MMTTNDDNGRQSMTTTKTNDKDKQHQQQTLTSNHAKYNAIINLATKNDKGDTRQGPQTKTASNVNDNQ